MVGVLADCGRISFERGQLKLRCAGGLQSCRRQRRCRSRQGKFQRQSRCINDQLVAAGVIVIEDVRTLHQWVNRSAGKSRGENWSIISSEEHRIGAECEFESYR